MNGNGAEKVAPVQPIQNPIGRIEILMFANNPEPLVESRMQVGTLHAAYYMLGEAISSLAKQQAMQAAKDGPHIVLAKPR